MLLGLFLAFAMQVPGEPNVHRLVPTTVGVAVVARETMSQIEEPKQVVARTPAEWAALWRQHAGESPMPKVDLGTRTIVAIFLGSRPSAGYEVDIIGTKEAGGALIVEWSERKPEPGDVAAQVLTSPAVIASIPKSSGAIRFVKVDR
jgi:PrcB C-terminal